VMNSFGGGLRNGILNISIKDANDLYSSYMPFVVNGGLFIPTRKPYQLGDEVFVLLDLMNESEKIPLSGKVVWMTPKGVANNRRQGIGVQFGENSEGLVARIETYIAGHLKSDRPTYTL